MLWPDRDAAPPPTTSTRRCTPPAARWRRRRAALGDGRPLAPEAEVDVTPSRPPRPRARKRAPRGPAPALALHGGELLPEDRYEPWADARRAALLELHAALCLELAEVARRRRRAAVAALQRALVADPLARARPPRAHAPLRCAPAAASRRSPSTSCCASSLDAELAAEPDPATRALYRELLARRRRRRPAPRGNLPAPADLASSAASASAPRSRAARARPAADAHRPRRLRQDAAGARGGRATRSSRCPTASGSSSSRASATPRSWPQAARAAPSACRSRRSARRRRRSSRTWPAAEALLVLDNCEHLDRRVRAPGRGRCCAPGPACACWPRAASRCAAPGEVAWRVPSLSLPEATTRARWRRALRAARGGAPGFEPARRRRRRTVAEICRRLDGMPLAHRAGRGARRPRCRSTQIAARLGDSLDVLAAGSRTALTRQQTLRATIDWSHDLLTGEERVLFRRLAVFAGGFTLEAAEDVCAGGADRAAPGRRPARAAGRQVAGRGRGAGRALPPARHDPPVRRRAARRVARARHGRAAPPRLVPGARGRRARPAVGRPAALAAARSSSSTTTCAPALAFALRRDPHGALLRWPRRLWRFWLDRGYFAEGDRWLDAVLEAAPEPRRCASRRCWRPPASRCAAATPTSAWLACRTRCATARALGDEPADGRRALPARHARDRRRGPLGRGRALRRGGRPRPAPRRPASGGRRAARVGDACRGTAPTRRARRPGWTRRSRACARCPTTTCRSSRRHLRHLGHRRVRGRPAARALGGDRLHLPSLRAAPAPSATSSTTSRGRRARGATSTRRGPPSTRRSRASSRSATRRARPSSSPTAATSSAGAGDLDAGEEPLRRALALRRELGDRRAVSMTLDGAGHAPRRGRRPRGRPRRARRGPRSPRGGRRRPRSRGHALQLGRHGGARRRARARRPALRRGAPSSGSASATGAGRPGCASPSTRRSRRSARPSPPPRRSPSPARASRASATSAGSSSPGPQSARKAGAKRPARSVGATTTHQGGPTMSVETHAPLAAGAVQELRDAVRGDVLAPGDPGYDEARPIWNGMFDDVRPALLVRCAGAADVIRAVELARSEDLEIAVRGGSHSLPGFSTSDGGLVIDLAPMRGARVDPAARRVVAEPGLLWQDLDAETQAFGLAATGGLVSTTGVSGLHPRRAGSAGSCASRAWPATTSWRADVVTADGRLVRAGAGGDPELLWGLRGGGGNFGVVTALELALAPVGPMVTGGLVFFDGERGEEVVRFFRDWTAERPARRAHDAAEPHDRAARAVPARGRPRPGHRRRRRVLRRQPGRRRARARAAARARRPRRRPPRPDPVRRVAGPARPALGPRRAQPHEGGLPRRLRRRRRRRARARLAGQALAALRAAPAPPRRRDVRRAGGGRGLRAPRCAVRGELQLALDRPGRGRASRSRGAATSTRACRSSRPGAPT